MCLLSATPKTHTFHAILQMRHRGQNCEFCHIESCGKNNVTSLLNLQMTFFFHIESIYIELLLACQLSYKMAP